MSLNVQIDKRGLDNLGKALAGYASISRRTPGKFVADMTSKLLLGEDVDGVGRNDGLFDRMRATAPARGSIYAAAQARKWRMGKPASTSISMARDRVNELLGRGESGAFKMSGGKFGSSWKLGSMYARGKRAGQVNVRSFGRRTKNPSAAVGVTRAAAQQAGASLLNRQSAIVAIAIQRREASRLASAVQFLPSRYRSTIKRIKGLVYRSGNAVGVSSADYGSHRIHETALVSNAKGRVLGTLEIDVGEKAASATIGGRYGIHTAAQVAAFNESVQMVTNYAVRRVALHLKTNADAAFQILKLQSR